MEGSNGMGSLLWNAQVSTLYCASGYYYEFCQVPTTNILNLNLLVG